MAVVWLLLGRLIIGCLRGQKLIELSEPIEDIGILSAIGGQARRMGLRYVPAFAACDVAVPCVVGFIRPMLLVPLVALSQLTPEQIEMVIAHELAHIRRFDPVINMLQRLIEAFLFFHPVIWSLSKEIQYVRECCCDDLVLNGGPDTMEYVQALHNLAQHVVSRFQSPLSGFPTPMLAATGEPSQLRSRIARLLKTDPLPVQADPVRMSRKSGIAFSMMAVALCAGMFRNLIAVSPAAASAIPALASTISPTKGSSPALSQLGIVNLKPAPSESSPNSGQLTSLHIAVQKGDIDEVRRLLKAEANPDPVTPQGWTPLGFAAYLGRIDMMAALIDAGADPNGLDYLARNSLYAAIGIGPGNLLGVRDFPNRSTVEYLVSRGAKVNMKDRAGMSPLDAAAVRGLDDICTFLLDHGASPNELDNLGRSAAVYACQGLQPKALRVILDRGGNPHIRQKSGWSLFDTLGLQPRTTGPIAPAMAECAVVLKQHGLRPNLCPAVSLELLDDVKNLLAAQSGDLADADFTYRGRSPLHWAVIRRDADICRLLIAAHANVNAVDLSNSAPLEQAASNAVGDTTILHLLLDAGAEIDQVDEIGRSAVFLAASHGDLTAVRFLMDHGAATHMLDSQGRSLLHSVFDAGPLPDVITDDGRDDTALLQLLLDAGLDINLQDRFGRTALFAAISRAGFTNVQFLLQHSANPDVEDMEGRMALSYLPKAVPAASISRFNDLFIRARQKQKG